MLQQQQVARPQLIGPLRFPFRSDLSAHALLLILLTSNMAARGHVQDPNDRRLRPIYGMNS